MVYYINLGSAFLWFCVTITLRYQGNIIGKMEKIMKIKPPQIPEALSKVTDFLGLMAAIKHKEYDISNVLLKDEFITDYDFAGQGFRNMVFDNCRFINCSFYKGCFTDVKFKNCDFSGSDFELSYFSRCEFSSSKAVGTTFPQSNFINVVITDSIFEYANFDNGKLQQIKIADSCFNYANITSANLKELDLSETQFLGTVFFKTPLKGINFTKCTIKNISISQDCKELKGMQVSLIQGAELSTFLGIEIVE